jgi:hypothetical protein
MKVFLMGILALLVLAFGSTVAGCLPRAAQASPPPEDQALEFYEFYSPM